jgi:RimJ/RimL family protein N-acetyltransferase
MARYLELETDRLRLRLWRESDVDPFRAFCRDRKSESVYGADAQRVDVCRRMALFVGHWHLRGFGPWALDDKATSRFAGYCGLWFPEGWDDIEIGYGIAPEFRGQGCAAEAARCVPEYGYRRKGLKRLVSSINPDNKASRRVAEKLGALLGENSSSTTSLSSSTCIPITDSSPSKEK